MKIKFFTCIAKNGNEAVVCHGAGKNIEDFKNNYSGNGELLQIKEHETALYNGEVFYEFLENVLKKSNYGYNEINHILAILKENEK